MTDVRIVPDAACGGALVAAHLAASIAGQPRYVLGVATGASPLTVYRALSTHVANGLDVSELTCFALDEYVGLPHDHPQRYRSVLLRELGGPLKLEPEQIRVPETEERCLATAGHRYEQLLEDAGGIDLQLLGIGRNGHLGFNEPSSSLASSTRVKTLTSETRTDNARFFTSLEQVPTRCVTQGLGTICRARHLVLLAFGHSKAAAIAAAVEGPVTSMIPASVVQLHPRATVVVDEAAASKLHHREYYSEVQRTSVGL